MNTEQFRDLLLKRGDSDWKQLTEEHALLIIDDLSLSLGSPELPNVVIPPNRHSTAMELKTQSLDEADTIVSDYYRTHPLTKTGFQTQAQTLISQHGSLAFVAPEGKLPERTLFVEGGEVTAQANDDPRHRYGAYYSFPNGLLSNDLEKGVTQWINSGAAYERYLEMNVCRYSC